MFALFLAALLIVAFCELQPLLLDGIFGIEHAIEANKQPTASQELLGTVSSWLKTLAALFASIGTVVGLFSKFLADALKRNTEKPGASAFATRIAIKPAMYVAGAAVPLGLWVIYLYLSYGGILSCKDDVCTDHALWLTALARKVPLAGGAVPLRGRTGSARAISLARADRRRACRRQGGGGDRAQPLTALALHLLLTHVLV